MAKRNTKNGNQLWTAKRLLCIASFLGLSLGGCSSKKQEEEMPAKASAEADDGDDSADETTPAATTAAEPATPAPAGDATPVMNAGGAAVRYVKTPGAPVLDAPNGKKISALNKGDHVLVWVDGEWAKTSEGHFISLKNLSEKGVSRSRSPAVWHEGVAH